MLESQTFDMEKYRIKRTTEIEAMKRNPETAFLVSNDEFDKQLDELGWSPSDLATCRECILHGAVQYEKEYP